MDIRMYDLQILEQEKERAIKDPEREKEKEDLQAERRNIEQEIKGFKSKKEDYKRLEAEIKKKEDENLLLEDEIKRKEKDLYASSKSNFKELESIKENIEELKEVLAKNEDAYLEMMGLADKKMLAMEEERQEIRKKQKAFNDNFKLYKESGEEKKRIIQEIEGEIEDFTKILPQETFNKYKAMMRKFPGSGIAIIEDKSKCSHCRLEVSVVKLRAVESGHITYCDNCSRLLAGKKEEIK